MSKGKAGLHQRNAHREGYNFELLTKRWPALDRFVVVGKHGKPTINFHDSAAVKCLNQALLIQHYNLEYWDIPPSFLCPAVPGRADYIHHLADLMASERGGKIPRGRNIRCLDIGTGANLVYPIVGSYSYGWSFVGTDIDTQALASAQNIIDKNTRLQDRVSVRQQTNRNAILEGIIAPKEFYDIVLCNPPFYASAKEAQSENQRKRKGLKAAGPQSRNFSGQANELWYPGGESAFIQKLIRESAATPTQCYWYTTLVAKEQHLKPLTALLKQLGSSAIELIPMAQGQKTSRILAWSFLNNKQRKAWQNARW